MNPFYNTFIIVIAILKFKQNITDPPTEKDIIVQAGALATHHTFERLHGIKNETFLITSSHDRITPQSVMEEIHERIPNSTLKIIEKAGHGSPRSRAPIINQMIIDFLKK